jgi:hypothetical protein
VENHLGDDCSQTGKLAWRQGWQINLAAPPLNWKITMALDTGFATNAVIVGFSSNKERPEKLSCIGLFCGKLLNIHINW